MHSPTATTRDSGMWPTPNAQVSQDGDGAETWLARREKLKDKGYNGNGAGTPLTIAAQLWPTPRSSPNENRNTKPAPSHGTTHGRTLAGDAALWATPTTRDWKDGTDPSSAVPTNSLLGRQAPRSGIGGNASSPIDPNSPPLWPTPTTDEATGYLSGSKRDTWRPTLSGAATGLTPVLHNTERQRKPPGARLNPLFVEWLMGLPIGWTDFARLATPSFPRPLPMPSTSSRTLSESEAA